MTSADAVTGAPTAQAVTASAPSAGVQAPAVVSSAPAVPSEAARELSPSRVAIVGLFVFAVIGVLAVGRVFFVPVVASVMLATVLSPLVARIESWRVPRVIGALAAIAIVVAVLFIAIEMLLEPLAKLLDTLPAMDSLLNRATRVSRQLFGAPYSDWMKARLGEFATQQGGTLSAGLFSGAAGASLGVGTVILLTFFVLASGDHFLQKLVRVIPRIRDKVNAVRIVRTVQQEVSHYFLTVALINVALGLVTGCICWYFELPNALLWGAVATLFNFVPYVGPLGSFALISIASLANFPLLSDALAVPLLFACVTLLEGQLITPMIVGRRVALHPVIVFVSLMFWAWIWGVAGMILAVPMVLVAKIWAQHTEVLAPWTEFLGPDTRNGEGRD